MACRVLFLQIAEIETFLEGWGDLVLLNASIAFAW
jgi:hypothetical protein